MLARENRELYLDKKIIKRGEAVEKMDTTVYKLTDEQKEYLSALHEIRDYSKPENKVKRMEKANRRMTGNFEQVYETSTGRYLGHFMEYTYFSIWDVISFMLLGMAFFKMGILTGIASTKLYALMCIIGLGLGIVIGNFQMRHGIDSGFNRFEYIKNMSLSYYDLGRVLRTLGIFGTLMLLHKSGIFERFSKLMRPVGQMAFTNYLTQSIIGTIIFTGIGFGLFGKLQRYEVYIIVLCIWIAQIVWSHAWLRYFQYGPFEWIWRQLTYWKKLPLKK